MEAPLNRITMNPGICHGKPCIRGLRYPVEMLLDLLSAGMTIDEILADYEDLEREDLLAAIAFGARLGRVKTHGTDGGMNFLVDHEFRRLRRRFESTTT
jgi:uncharacterized protein (DUF433 family)